MRRRKTLYEMANPLLLVSLCELHGGVPTGQLGVLMDKTLKKKWVEALLSGEYKQCENTLTDGVGYCCLGVLQKIATGKEPPLRWCMEDPWLEWGLRYKHIEKLADLNDEGVPFDMIAGLIDEAL